MSSFNHDPNSEINRESFAIKCARISRHLIFTLTIIMTLTAFGYSIYIPVKCNEEVAGKDCPLGYAKDICSQSLSAVISLSISIMIIGGMLVGINYMFFLVGLGVALLCQLLYIIPLAVNDNPAHLTRGSPDTIFKEILRCPLTSNATKTSDSECWELFRSKYCSDWLMAENRVCQTFGAECDLTNRTYCSGDEYDHYWNMTPSTIVNQCMDRYEPWVFGTHNHFYKMALDLLVSITVVHTVLFCFMLFAVYAFKHFKNTSTVMNDVVAT